MVNSLKNKMCSKIDIARNYYTQAFDAYKVHSYNNALIILFKSLTINPFYKRTWILVLKSLSYLIFPESINTIFKKTYRCLLQYIDFFFFMRSYPHFAIYKNKKNILFIVSSINTGGAARVNLNIAKGVNKEEFALHIVVTNIPNSYLYGEFNSLFKNVIVPIKQGFLWEKCFDYIITKLKIDIVLTSGCHAGYEYLPHLKSKFKHIKVLDILHAETSIGCYKQSAVPYIDRRICISSHLKRYMMEKYKKWGVEDGKNEKLKVIYNGIDVKQYRKDGTLKGKFKSRFSIPNDTKIISFIGRFSSEKNLLLFVKIAKNIISKSNNNKLTFVMAGDGPQFKEIKNIIMKHKIDNYFVLTGMIDNIVELLADTSILLLVSKHEGIPFVLLEAMAMEVPLISTDVGAIHEVVKNDINGYLVDLGENTVESFSRKILDLLSERLNYHTVVKEAKETMMRNYSLETMGSHYQHIFNELLSV